MGTSQSIFPRARMSPPTGVGVEAVVWSIYSAAVPQLAERLLMKTLLFESCCVVVCVTVSTVVCVMFQMFSERRRDKCMSVSSVMFIQGLCTLAAWEAFFFATASSNSTWCRRSPCFLAPHVRHATCRVQGTWCNDRGQGKGLLFLAHRRLLIGCKSIFVQLRCYPALLVLHMYIAESSKELRQPLL